MQECCLVERNKGMHNSVRLPTMCILATFNFPHLVYDLNRHVGKGITGGRGEVAWPPQAAESKGQQIIGWQSGYFK